MAVDTCTNIPLSEPEVLSAIANSPHFAEVSKALEIFEQMGNGASEPAIKSSAQFAGVSKTQEITVIEQRVHNLKTWTSAVGSDASKYLLFHLQRLGLKPLIEATPPQVEGTLFPSNISCSNNLLHKFLFYFTGK